MRKLDLIEYEIYLPGSSRTLKAIRALKNDLTEFFGGLTDTRHKNRGLWRIGDVIVKDEIVIWRVISDRKAAGDRFMKRMRRDLETALGEETILIVRRQVSRI